MNVQKNPSIISQRNSDGDIVLYNPETGDIHITNEIGYLIFILCECYTLDEIATHIHVLTGEDMQKIIGDMYTFIEDLTSHGYLLEIGDP
ncbi:PqqD family peptide modification chaperone [Thermococcus sp. 101 C5]|uniref:PqqD family protein n=1 Tax=Thermococcus sp. 101 C5 TaxID=2654197 RepID=UPI00128E7DB0|nr:PqqD family protein [Thermococcus sp. 101 C5]MPW39223.1 PqqD family peptide modification chaperone [Thermococcus sp. 101 C5]